ncbi:hypothetical protein KAT36_02955 [Candidatus Pacearchaeota archaeon]|nr:hypothetical protein [Candidatus Pacearchaeota archaeon]
MENHTNTRNTSQEIDSVGRAKLDSLQNNIEELKNMIKERNTLGQNFIKEGESMKANIKTFLIENSPEGEGDSEFARERSELRKKQIEISELQLNEKINCWRDIALLKKEFRENIKELNEKKSRADMLEKILKE